VAGRAPKNEPAILVIAMAAKLGDDATRAAAYAAMPQVCRTGTHLYHWAQFINELGGWGRATKRAVAKWFNDHEPDQLAYQLMKYQQRDGWSSRDLLRMAHVVPRTDAHDALYAWAVDPDQALAAGKPVPASVQAFEELKAIGLGSGTTKRACDLITEFRLPRECVPSELLKLGQVWEALLPHMGLTAMIRNLATMTRAGVLTPLGKHTGEICQRVTDREQLKRARVHPIAVLAALRTYQQGHGERGNSTWTPVQQIVDALDAGFYAAFDAVESTGKRTLLALDVSGSMGGGQVSGVPGLSPREASAALAMVTMAVEPQVHALGFSHKLIALPLSPPRQGTGDCADQPHAAGIADRSDRPREQRRF